MTNWRAWRKGIAHASVVGVASVAAAGCGVFSPQNTGAASAQFEITNLSDPGRRAVTAQNGASLQFPASSNLDVKVNAAGSPGALSMHVFVTAFVSSCGDQQIPNRYAGKQIEYPHTETQATALVQDWPLSGWTLRLLGICRDPSSPAYPSRDEPPGSFLIRAQVQDAAGNWSEAGVAIHIGEVRPASCKTAWVDVQSGPGLTSQRLNCAGESSAPWHLESHLNIQRSWLSAADWFGF